MEPSRPTHTFHRLPSDSYNMNQLRNPQPTQQDQPSPTSDYGSPHTPPHSNITSNPSRSGQIPLAGLDQYPSSPLVNAGTGAQRPRGVQHASYASTDTAFTQESAQSQDRLLGNTRESGRLQPREQHVYSDIEFPETNSQRWKWINGSWGMYFFLILGIVGASGHHAFYQHLAGKPATNQIEMLRYGAALAYATKASFIAAVVFAYRQQIWATFRRKSLKMTTIDSLFAAVDDLGALFSLDMARMAKSALALAVMCWYVPTRPDETYDILTSQLGYFH
jgi:hypothetical protein